MNPAQFNRTLMVLVAIVAIGTTALVAMAILKRNGALDSRPGPGMAYPDPTADSLPPLAAVPDFNLIERSGKPVTRADLVGKVWIASFIFTKCAGACPMMTSKLYTLQEDLKKLPGNGWDDVRLVSVSVDPETDTPDVLKERARISLADETHWLWITGEKKAVRSLTRDGFKLAVEDQPNDPANPVAHSQKFVLVDKKGQIRGYYDGLDSEYVNADFERQRLMRDLNRLLAEK